MHTNIQWWFIHLLTLKWENMDTCFSCSPWESDDTTAMLLAISDFKPSLVS